MNSDLISDIRPQKVNPASLVKSDTGFMYICTDSKITEP